MTIPGLALFLLLGFQQAPHPVAITGARIVADPSTVIESGTILMRNGLIEAVGTDVPIPPDAEVIDGAGLSAYAGFIDGFCQLGLPGAKTSDEDRRKTEDIPFDFKRSASAGMESANRKGIQADFQAAHVVEPSEPDLLKWRRSGFSVAAVAATGQFLGGRGCIISLNGRPRRSMIIRASHSQYASWSASGEGYPSTVMGTLAHLRQVASDATRYAEVRAAYDRNPAGPRPPLDSNLAAIADLVHSDKHLSWEASSGTEIDRSLGFGVEYGLTIMIIGGTEAFKTADRLLQSGSPVILSLHWPPEIPPDGPNHVDETREDVPPRLESHRKEERNDRIRCALRLHEAGIRFCFTTAGVEVEAFLDRVRDVIKEGLPESAAVAALTLNAASILDIDSTHGKIAPGSAASLTVLTRPLADKMAKVRYVFADGRKFETEPAKIGPGELAGTWTLTGDQFSARCELQQSGSGIKGTLTIGTASGEISGSVSGTGFTLQGTVSGTAYSFAGTLSGGTLTGTVTDPAGKEVPWTAARKPD